MTAKSHIITARVQTKNNYAEYFKCKRMLVAKVDSYKDNGMFYDLLKYYKELDESDLFPNKKDEVIDLTE